jgi:hypothetical protein
MDGTGNVFSNSLATLGQWLLNNPQGTGLPQGLTGGTPGATTSPNAPGGMPTRVPTSWQGGQPGAPQDTVQVSTEQFAQPNLPGAQRAPFQNQASSAGGGGGGGTSGSGQPYTPQGGDGAMNLSGYSGGGGATVGDFMAGNAAGPGAQDLGTLGGAGGGQNPAQGAVSSAFSGISSALSKAGQSIAGVNTMPSIVQGGSIPSIQQQPAELQGRRPQPMFMG